MKDKRLSKNYEILKLGSGDIHNITLIEEMLSGKLLFINGKTDVAMVWTKYPFLPVGLAYAKISFAVYKNPISKYSPYFKQIFYWFQIAFEFGIYHHASQLTDRIAKSHERDAEELLDFVLSQSDLNVGLKDSEHNAMLFSKYLLIFGFAISGLFLLREFLRNK